MSNSERHRIRLRGPWWRSAGTVFDTAAAVRIRLPSTPAEQQGGDSTSPSSADYVFRRPFNRPTGLQGGDVVWLVLEGIADLQTVRLNDQPIWQRRSSTPESMPLEIAITKLLQDANQLELQLALPCPALPYLSGETRLEIAPGLSST